MSETDMSNRIEEIQERHARFAKPDAVPTDAVSQAHADRGHLLDALAAVGKEREELKLKLAREDRAHEITIGQRDAFEEFIGDMAHGFEPDAEWSNLCDLRDVVSDGIDELRARLASVERVVEAAKEVVAARETHSYERNHNAIIVLRSALASLPPSGEGKAEAATLDALKADNLLFRKLYADEGHKAMVLQEQLSASTAREAGMREALEKIAKADGPSFPIAFARCVDIASAALAAADSAATQGEVGNG